MIPKSPDEIFQIWAQLIEVDPERWSKDGVVTRWIIDKRPSWTVRCTPGPSIEKDTTESVDCEVAMSSEDFGFLIDGSLNPQIAYLDGKIQVSGGVNAVLQQNIIIKRLQENLS